MEGKPNSLCLLWSPALSSQPRVCCSLLPRIIPLGSSGGCQTIRTDVSLTSGNTSLTGGPGAGKKNRDCASKHCMWKELQIFCSPCIQGSPSRISPIISRWSGAPTYVYNILLFWGTRSTAKCLQHPWTPNRTQNERDLQCFTAPAKHIWQDALATEPWPLRELSPSSVAGGSPRAGRTAAR